jgi:hypothetical protein
MLQIQPGVHAGRDVSAAWSSRTTASSCSDVFLFQFWLETERGQDLMIRPGRPTRVCTIEHSGSDRSSAPRTCRRKSAAVKGFWTKGSSRSIPALNATDCSV